MSLGLKTTSVQCVFVPAQTCVDLRPELDPAVLKVFVGFVLAIMKTEFRSLLITPIQHPSVQCVIYTVHVRTLMNTFRRTDMASFPRRFNKELD